MINHLVTGPGHRLSSLELGPVVLNVSDLRTMREFYAGPIGLDALDEGPDSAVFGSGGRPMVELREAADAPPRPPGTSGLFHLAVLEPSREALAASLRRLVDAGVRLGGASDHIVSEALYLNDPEGNGIEIYRDRPAGEWRWRDGQVEMATLPLNLDSLLAEPPPPPDEAGGAGGPGVTLGHVHMNVGDLGAARAFYEGILGLDVTTDRYPGALFVSAGGYHHHLGLNLWQGIGAPAPPAGSRGLAGLTVRVPGENDLVAIAVRAKDAGLPVVREETALQVTDPFGVPIRVEAS